MGKAYTSSDNDLAMFVGKRPQWLGHNPRDWWWGWSLAQVAVHIVTREYARDDHHRMLDRLVRTARDIRKRHGSWPAEILVRDGCSVERISVVDEPDHAPVLISPLTADEPTHFRVITIPVGEVRGVEQGVWSYRGTPGGPLIWFEAWPSR